MGYGRIRRNFPGSDEERKKASARIERRGERKIIEEELLDDEKDKDLPRDFLLIRNWYERMEAQRLPAHDQTEAQRDQEGQIRLYIQTELGRLKNEYLRGLQHSYRHCREVSEGYFRKFTRKECPELEQAIAQKAYPQLNELLEMKSLVPGIRSKARLLYVLEIVYSIYGYNLLTWLFPPGLERLRSWKPDKSSFHDLLKSYIEHFGIRYRVPEPFFSLFYLKGGFEVYDPIDSESELFSDLLEIFRDIGRGASVYRALDSKGYPVSHRMCHLLSEVPADLTFLQALRYAELWSAGGSPRIIRILLAYERDLGMTPNHRFWQEVYRMIFRQPLFDPAMVAPVLIYLNYRKATDPEYSLKGRTLRNILGEIEAFFRGIVDRRRTPGALMELLRGRNLGTYSRAGLPDYRAVVPVKSPGSHQVWEITEISSPMELYAEGRRMHHCVFSYNWRITLDKSDEDSVSMWSMTLDGRPVLTLCVVTASGEISEVRGLQNRCARPEEIRHIRAWARQAGLTISAELGF